MNCRHRTIERLQPASATTQAWCQLAARLRNSEARSHHFNYRIRRTTVACLPSGWRAKSLLAKYNGISVRAADQISAPGDA
jgi:hypothetical protein